MKILKIQPFAFEGRFKHVDLSWDSLMVVIQLHPGILNRSVLITRNTRYE